jgi:signal transduction histidine kinase
MNYPTGQPQHSDNHYLFVAPTEQLPSQSPSPKPETGSHYSRLQMDIQLLSKNLTAQNDIIRQKIDAMIGLIDDTVQSIHRLTASIKPGILRDMGLVSALLAHAQRAEKESGVRVVFSSQLPHMILPALFCSKIFVLYEDLLLYITALPGVQEIHSSFQLKNNCIVLTARYQGQQPEDAAGLDSIIESVFATAGIFDLDSAGNQTTVIITIPIP